MLTFYSMVEPIQAGTKISHARVPASKEASRWPGLYRTVGVSDCIHDPLSSSPSPTTQEALVHMETLTKKPASGPPRSIGHRPAPNTRRAHRSPSLNLSPSLGAHARHLLVGTRPPDANMPGVCRTVLSCPRRSVLILPHRPSHVCVQERCVARPLRPKPDVALDARREVAWMDDCRPVIARPCPRPQETCSVCRAINYRAHRSRLSHPQKHPPPASRNRHASTLR